VARKRFNEEQVLDLSIDICHSTINRWVVKYAPILAKKFEQHKRSIGKRWRLDETYIKVRGQWKYFYRAVDSNAVGRTR